MEGQRVVLHRITSEGGAAVDSALTDPRGGFAFALPAPDTGSAPPQSPVYLVTTRYSGVVYFGPALHGGDRPGDYRVDVYPAERASPADGLTLRSRILVVAPEDGAVRVMDVVVARGEPDRTLVGPAAAGDARRPWWAVAVPGAARDVRVLPGAVKPEEVTFGAGEARVAAAVPPSGQRLVLGYRIPAGSPVEIALRNPVGRVEVVARRAAGRVRVPGAERVEPLEVEGDRLDRYRMEDRAAGDTVRIVVDRAGGGAGDTAGWIAVAVGVLLFGAAAWTWRRRRAGAGSEARRDARSGDAGR